MKLQLKSVISILLCAFVALSLVQAAGATDISVAPLNPEFIQYFGEEQNNAAETVWTDTDSQNAANPQIFSGGLIPAPSTPVWPSGEQVASINVICADAAPLPSYLNLRDEGRLTPVRDQGDCDVEWAFATYGSLESTLLTDTGIEWDFSENNMKNLLSNGYSEGYDREPCDGGNALMSTAYLARWSGPVNEADDPYLLQIPSTYPSTDLAPVLHVQNVTWLPPREDSLNNNLLKQTLYESGALYTEFYVNYSCFGQNVTDYHNGTSYYRPDESHTIDFTHAVTLVGWDDNYPAANFTVTPPEDGAFIIKNSWGTDAGDEGYLYISYYDTSFAIADNPVLFTAEPADRLDNIYQYDPLGGTAGYGCDGISTTIYGANVFTADGYEDLRAVSFYTIEPGTEYVAAIFRDIDTPPGSAAGPVTWVSGTTDLSGYHTIPLPKAVSLSPDQTFSVVLKVTAPTDTYPLVVEVPYEDYSSQATAVAGQSYVSDYGDEWDDITTLSPDTNVCIKAFTTDALRVPTNYLTIQSAVDAAGAGDTVIVESGTYRENVVLNTTITLRGIDTGEGLPVIDACGNSSALSVTANGVTVEGVVLTGAGEEYGDAGLYVEADNTTLVNLTAWENACEGIVIYDSKNAALTGCSALSNTGYGIYIEDSSGSTLNNCSANGNGVGIEVTNSPGSTLTDCIANDNAGNGIRIYNTQCANNLKACTDATTLSSHSEVIQYLPEADTTGMRDDPILRADSPIPLYIPLENEPEMSVSKEGEVNTYAISGYSGISLTGCQADSNDKGGFIIVDTSSAQLTNCSANENKYGMYLSYSTNCTLMNNSMNGNLYNFNIEGNTDTCYTHSIDTSNTVNGKPIYYLRDATENPEEDFANAGTIFAVSCTGLDIHDLTLSGNKFGIYFWNTTSSTITDVTTEENEYGICLDTSSDIRIDTCEATHNTWDGIYLYDCSAVEADNCRATENGYLGIHLYKSEQCTLTGNAMDDNEYNFNVQGWEDADYYHSIDISNTVNGKTLYYLLNATGNPDGDFADAGIIYAVNCTGLDIHDLTFSNEYAGVCILNCSGLDIHNLTLTDNFLGILISTGTDITLDTIRATENYYGIYLEGCSESTIQGCIGRNNNNGLISRFSDNNLITDCTMLENERYGIQLYSSENCTVRNCSASLNDRGFFIFNSENCHISECTVSNNTGIGLGADYSDNCIVSLNSFVNNSATESYSYDILWNSPSALTYLYGEHMWKQTSPMGNYWGAAYNGTDLNGDGIGDTLFTGDGFNDTFPLMEPLSAYTFVEDTDSGDDTGGDHNVGAAGNLNAGDAVTMQFSGTAVTGITITAAEHINTMVVTIGPVKTGPEGLNGPVYQYLEADLIHTTNNAIGEANFTFDVPTAWLTAQGLNPADVVLWRFHDGVWVPLPTEIVNEEANNIVYRAVSPGFSYFAVGEGEAGVSHAETTPSEGAETGTTPAQENESTAQPVIPSETEGEAATATPPQQSPAGFVSILAGMGAAALLFRRH